MTPREARRRTDMFGFDDLAPDFRRIAIRHPIELRHQLRRPDVRCRIAVALQTKCHVERLLLMHFDHLIDTAMATYAAHSRRYMRRMIKINEVWKAMNLHPGNRLTGCVTL